MVTKAQLDALRAARPTLNTELHLTPDDMTVVSVHSCVEAERIGVLNKGDKRMQLSQQKLRADLEQARNEGFNRVQFNQNAHTHELNL